jgi:Fic family protein
MRSSEALVGTLVQKAKFWMAHAQTDLNARQREALNRMLAAEPTGFEGGMTNSKYVNLTKASAATAQRDLAALVEAGCLIAVGSGRGVRYQLNLEHRNR